LDGADNESGALPRAHRRVTRTKLETLESESFMKYHLGLL
jgi:hypothetical protein